MVQEYFKKALIQKTEVEYYKKGPCNWNKKGKFLNQIPNIQVVIV